jgi:putative aldouronate transport system permease protein
MTKSTLKYINKNTLYIMAISCFAFVAVFSYIPLLGWSIAFIDYKPGLKLSQCEFVGLKYFILALRQPDLLPVLRNTIIMSFLGLLCSPLPAFFAISLSEMNSKKFSKLIQISTTFPNFISWVLVFSVFYAMLSPNDGVVNKILLSLHIIEKPMNPIGNPDIVYLFQTAISLWKSIGFSAIIYLAALTSIDTGLYDAAEVDGAGRFAKIIHIKIPGLYPTYFVLLLLSIGQFLNNGFEQYYLFYNGLVGEKIEVLDYYVYRLGIVGNGYPLATAIGIAKTVISVLLLTGANNLSKRIRGESIL